MRRTSLILMVSIILLFSRNTLFSSNIKGLDGIYSIPSALTCSGYSYYNSPEESYLKYTQSFGMSVFEVAYMKAQEEGDKDVISGKMKIMKESYYLPGMAVGIYNYNSNTVQPSYFFAMSKSLQTTGTLLHAGVFREKSVDDIEYNPYFGLEQQLYSSFSVMAEYTQGKKVNAGLRLGSGGLSVDVIFPDVSNNFDFDTRRYNVSMEQRF